MGLPNQRSFEIKFNMYKSLPEIKLKFPGVCSQIITKHLVFNFWVAPLRSNFLRVIFKFKLYV